MTSHCLAISNTGILVLTVFHFGDAHCLLPANGDTLERRCPGVVDILYDVCPEGGEESD